MRLLVTGGLGYLGGRLVEYLRQKPEFSLRLLVRQVPPSLANWVQVMEVRLGDLTRPESLRGIGEGIDAVIHLAALNEVQCERDPIAALRVNVEGTLHLLEALGNSPRLLVFLSTFHVYGANGHGVVTEQTPLAPIHPYATTHAMAELHVGMVARQRRQGAVILRLSNSVGAPIRPGVDRWTLLVNDLCRQAVEQRRLVLRSSGLQVRDFVPMADVVRVFDFLFQQDLADVRTYNLGNSTSVSVLEVAQKVREIYARLYGQTLPIERPNPKPGETSRPLHFRCDPIRALGFTPHASLDDAIQETLQFCHRHFHPQSAG